MNAALSARLLPALVILVAMIAAPMLADAIRPTTKMADEGLRIDLEAMIPRQFGEWNFEDSAQVLVVNPQQQATLERIYSQTLTRTYVNSEGYRVMLSIAYGGNQSDSMQVHRPDVCYVAQGFMVSQEAQSQIGINKEELPVKRLVARHGIRVEPITYWITVGNDVVVSGFQQKLIQLKYGLVGQIPDGLLVRASSIDEKDSSAYQMHDAFITAMIASLPSDARAKLTGHPGR